MDSDNLAQLQELSDAPKGWNSTAWLTSKNTWLWYKNRGCHGYLPAIPKGPYTDVVTTLYYGKQPSGGSQIGYDECTAYWAWLASDDCPWRALKRELMIGKDDKIIGMKIIDGANAQPHLFMNFLIATRIAYEHPPMIRAFNKFLRAGFTETQAYYLMYHFNETADGGTIINPRQGHFALDTVFSIPSFDRLNTGKPSLPNNAKWNDNRQYTPNNVIWGTPRKGNDMYYLSASSYIQDKMKPYAKMSEYKGSFGDRFKRQHNNKMAFPTPEIMKFDELTKALKKDKEFFSG